MPYADFRAFLDVLRAHDELIDIDRPIDLYVDVARALKQSNVVEGPALNFRQNGTAFPLVGGVYSTRAKALLAFEATEDTVLEKILHGLDTPIAPLLVDGPAPVHDVVLTGEDIDVTQFPIPTYSPADGGAYITPGIVVSRDPHTGVNDIGHYRFMLVDKRTLAFFAQPFHRFGKNIIASTAAGRVQQGALVIGCDPMLAYAAQVQVSDTTDDWTMAGGLRGAAVELVRCKTVDLAVPATAEVVIEFEVDTAQRVAEGPLGEYTGYYTPASDEPVARITAITHRARPYFQALLTGKPVTENHILKQLTFEASFYRELKRNFPTVRRVAMPPSGGVSYYTVIQIEPRYAGEARQAILAAIASNQRPKWVIAVDPDIDVTRSSEIEWALSFRVHPAHDILIVGDVPGAPADPQNAAEPVRAKQLNAAVGIDATRAYGSEFADVADVPGWQAFDMPELRER
jgi:4-hydroxy-3-polyprenylbenzoate decarboxylase/2,5-furandicarboxylate decarboxylase 1